MHDQHTQSDDLPSVLLIDDSEFVHRLLESRLKSEDLRLLYEPDGASGLERAVREQPSLIMLDLDMPVMDGYETIRELVERPETRNIPIIVLSGTDTLQDKVTMFDLGAMDFVCKPFEITELRARIRSSLRISSLLRMLEQKAQIDGLTGLYNREYFQQRWTQEYDRSVRSSAPLALAMIDIDNFKSINDSFGHPAGDAVISGLARLLQRHLRQYDVACRYGGEEFVLILPSTTTEQAAGICERIRAECERIQFPKLADRGVTMSIGICACESGPTMTADAWIEQADACLYRAKEAGRNRIVSHEPPEGDLSIPRAG